MFFLLFILHDTEKLTDVYTAWENVGVSGITILPGVSFSSIPEKQALQEDFPIIPNLEDIVETQEIQTRTLFAIASTQEIADAVYEATISIVGDLSEPNSGVFLILPVQKAYGLIKK